MQISDGREAAAPSTANQRESQDSTKIAMYSSREDPSKSSTLGDSNSAHDQVCCFESSSSDQDEID